MQYYLLMTFAGKHSFIDRKIRLCTCIVSSKNYPRNDQKVHVIKHTLVPSFIEGWPILVLLLNTGLKSSLTIKPYVLCLVQQAKRLFHYEFIHVNVKNTSFKCTIHKIQLYKLSNRLSGQSSKNVYHS